MSMTDRISRVRAVWRTKNYTAKGAAIITPWPPLILMIIMEVIAVALYWGFEAIPYHNLLASVLFLQVLRG